MASVVNAPKSGKTGIGRFGALLSQPLFTAGKVGVISSFPLHEGGKSLLRMLGDRLVGVHRLLCDGRSVLKIKRKTALS